jgi:hypothetical protein
MKRRRSKVALGPSISPKAGTWGTRRVSQQALDAEKSWVGSCLREKIEN